MDRDPSDRDAAAEAEMTATRRGAVRDHGRCSKAPPDRNEPGAAWPLALTVTTIVIGVVSAFIILAEPARGGPMPLAAADAPSGHALCTESADHDCELQGL